MININGIQILDSWDGSREGVSVVISRPQEIYASLLTKEGEVAKSTIIALFRNDKSISNPYSLVSYDSELEEYINAKIEDLKKVFGPDIEIIRQ